MKDGDNYIMKSFIIFTPNIIRVTEYRRMRQARHRKDEQLRKSMCSFTILTQSPEFYF
jgi:hypothetical protein